MPLNKSDIVERLAKEHELSLSRAKDIVENVFEQIKEELRQGGKVTVLGFGTFESVLQAEKEKTGFNNAQITVTERYRIKFTISREFKFDLMADKKDKDDNIKNLLALLKKK